MGGSTAFWETKQEQGQLTYVAAKYYKTKTGVLRQDNYKEQHLLKKKNVFQSRSSFASETNLNDVRIVE